MSAGHIQRRGKSSWRLKFDAGRDPETGQRNIQYVTVRGTKAAAKAKLVELVAAVGNGSYVEPSKVAVAEHVRARIAQWEAAGAVSARTAERYRELLDHQIAPHIGAKPVQKLSTLDVEQWHAALRTQVSARTIGHAHRVLSHALRDAVRHRLVVENVASAQGAPKVEESEVEVVPHERIGELVDKLRGRTMYARAITSLFTGMRRGEVLALRWQNVDLGGAQITVAEALEETEGGGIRVKPPQSKAGRRTISLPAILVDALREHRREQLELRIALGIGKMPDDALVFPAPLKGGYQSPRTFSKEWARVATAIAFDGLTFHALRHTHASQLIGAGVDIVTISRRLGHAKPDITLRIYAHLFRKDDSKAADAINDALAALGS
jgi:integrase